MLECKKSSTGKESMATNPINMKTNMPAVIRAPRDAGDSIPSIASTTTVSTRVCDNSYIYN